MFQPCYADLLTSVAHASVCLCVCVCVCVLVGGVCFVSAGSVFINFRAQPENGSIRGAETCCC